MSKLYSIINQFGTWQSPKDSQPTKITADIKDLMLELIGEDVEAYRGGAPEDYYHLGQNYEKSILRNKVNEL